LAHEVDRLLAEHARDRPPAGVQGHALTHEHLSVPAADGPEPQVALVVDVGDDQSDLVDVTHDQQARRGLLEAVLGGHARQGAAHHVRADSRELARGPAPDGRGGALIAGWSARGEQVEQQPGCATLRRRRLAHVESSARNTYSRIPPWRKYSASRGVSIRTRAPNAPVPPSPVPPARAAGPPT